MAKHDSYLKMTGDDLRAARVLTLAVKFFGSSKPVSSSSIRADLYPELDPSSFKRQFLRDRELLATFGLVIREAGSTDDDTLWQVDERTSYVQGEGLSAKDARMLYILCHDMAFDQAFPYRDELRMALAKISRMYRGSVVTQTDQTTPGEHKLLSTLVGCLSHHHAAAVTYTDATGKTSDRTLAILGSFGLRGHTYFVASRIERDGTLVPDSIRTYRLDRFEKARELPRISYRIPLDFSVNDFERLPFQMGDACGTARIELTEPVNKQVSRAVSTHGTVAEPDGQCVWEVPYSDAAALASWAIGAGVTPLGPDEVVQARRDLLVKAAETDIYDQQLVDKGDAVQQTIRARRPGRTGSVSVARQLVALATSLTNEGEIITAQNIASTLGVSYDEARHLIALVSLGSGESIDYLPVILSDDDGEVSLMEGAELSARRVRLTRSETIALRAALSELGVDDTDPLVQTLNASYAAPTFSADDIAQSLEAPSSASDSATLRACSQAIVDGNGLSFCYDPVTGGPQSTRRVMPQLVRRGDDCWYLDAFDLDRRGRRVFRIDRMSSLSQIAAETRMPKTGDTTATLVLAHFADERYLDLFHWDGLQLVTRDNSGTTVRIPHYGGTWLAAHLAACAGTVHVNDRQLARDTQTYARDLLDASFA